MGRKENQMLLEKEDGFLPQQYCSYSYAACRILLWPLGMKYLIA